MIVSVFVIADGPLLDAFGGDLQGQVDISVLSSGSREDSKLYGVKGVPGISSGHIGEKFHRVFIYHRTVIPHSFLTVVDRPEDQGADVICGKGLQFKNDGT